MGSDYAEISPKNGEPQRSRWGMQKKKKKKICLRTEKKIKKY